MKPSRVSHCGYQFWYLKVMLSSSLNTLSCWITFHPVGVCALKRMSFSQGKKIRELWPGQLWDLTSCWEYSTNQGTHQITSKNGAWPMITMSCFSFLEVQAALLSESFVSPGHASWWNATCILSCLEEFPPSSQAWPYNRGLFTQYSFFSVNKVNQ